MKNDNVRDINSQTNWINRQFKANIFSKDYFTFILVLVVNCALMGYVVSQLYETQKDLKELKTQYEVTNIYLAKIDKEEN
jgi:Mn2+/Fe2+ NRAMP family transporter